MSIDTANGRRHYAVLASSIRRLVPDFDVGALFAQDTLEAVVAARTLQKILRRNYYGTADWRAPDAVAAVCELESLINHLVEMCGQQNISEDFLKTWVFQEAV